MLIKKGNPLEQKWNASNVYGSSENTPRHLRMNPINKIPDEFIVKYIDEYIYIEVSTGEIYKFKATPSGWKNALNTMSKHMTYYGIYSNIDKRTVETRVYNEINGEKVWID